MPTEGLPLFAGGESRATGVVEECRAKLAARRGKAGGWNYDAPIPACITIYAADMETVVRTQDCVDWCPLLRRKIDA